MQDLDEVARDQVMVRSVVMSDLDAMVAIDTLATGRKRDRFLRQKLTQALQDTGIAMSLAAELDGHLVGFLLARVYYGEFGVMEPSAVMDVLGVHPDYRGRHVAAALVDQLRTNLLGLGIATLQTEVRWDSPDLLSFFQHEGFTIAPRICLDLDLARTRT
jgi:ribosomal protein S18 acetylase RimI-like enzyme